MKPLLWSELTWEQLRDMRREGVDLVLFPVGSTTQHGPHLPSGVDNVCAEIVAHAVSARTGVPVLPLLPFGCSREHTRHWPGTLSLSPAALSLVVREIGEELAAYGFTRILILNGSEGNAAPLQCALEELRVAHPDMQIAHRTLADASPRTRSAFDSDGENGHGNAAETALLLHLAPRTVRTERIFDVPGAAADSVFAYTAPQTTKSGHRGSPSQATAAMGEELFEALVRDWTYLVKKALIEKPPLQRPKPTTLPASAAPPGPTLPPAISAVAPPAAAPLQASTGNGHETNGFEAAAASLFRAPTQERPQP